MCPLVNCEENEVLRMLYQFSLGWASYMFTIFRLRLVLSLGLHLYIGLDFV
jgi:hypothetical protein